MKEARSHLDLLTSNTFRLRGTILQYTEQAIGAEADLWKDALGQPDWAKRYCNLYARSRVIDLNADADGLELISKQAELTAAFEAWYSALANMPQDPGDLAVRMLRIEVFFSWFILCTLRDRDETSCDRFREGFAELVELAVHYLERTKATAGACGFALESGILRSLYIVGLKCRDTILRRRAVDLLRNATVQEGLWSGRVFAGYLQRVVDVEEKQARQLRPDIPQETPLTYETVPDAARIHDVVLASDDTRPALARVVCAQRASGECSALRFVEDKFQLLSV